MLRSGDAEMQCTKDRSQRYRVQEVLLEYISQPNRPFLDCTNRQQRTEDQAQLLDISNE